MTKRWPLHPRPYPNESLLSWIMRTASLYNMEPEKILQYECGIPIAHKDLHQLDLNPSIYLMRTLSERTGIEFDSIRALIAQSYVPLLIDSLDLIFDNDYVNQFPIFSGKRTIENPRFAKGWSPWFNSQRFALLYGCATCLTEDPDPYFRLYWRFPWLMSCPLHNLLLAPVLFFSTGNGLDFFFDKECIPAVPQTVETLYVMDSMTLQAITTGMVNIPAGRQIHGGIWIRLLRTLLEELNTPSSKMSAKTKKLIAPFWQDLNLDFREGLSLFKTFEDYDPRKQCLLMQVAANILKVFFSNPTKFSSAAQQLISPLYDKRNTSRILTVKTFSEITDEFIVELHVDPKNVQDFRAMIKACGGKRTNLEAIDNCLIELGISIPE